MRRPESEAASELLGSMHPLVGRLELFEVLVKQSAVVIGVLAGSTIAIAWQVALAPPVAAAAAAVEITLCTGIAMTVQSTRSKARDLIIEGYESLPLRCIASERRRLLDPNQRQRMARLVGGAVDAADNWERLAVASRPPQAITRIRPVANELRDLAAELTGGEMSVRAVALIARMLAGGYTSPVYAGRVDELRAELIRIRHLA